MVDFNVFFIELMQVLGKMFENFVIAVIKTSITILQVIVFPINSLISANFPNFTDLINQLTLAFDYVSSTLSWVFDFIPPNLQSVLLVILNLEILKWTVYLSVIGISKFWELIRKIKIW